jgi:putative sterol carrier protein
MAAAQHGAERMASVEDITQYLRGKLEQSDGLDRSLLIDLKGEGFIRMEGKTVTNDSTPADCTIVVAKDDIMAMSRGELDPTMAFMTGRLKINGDMSVAMKLQPILSQA